MIRTGRGVVKSGVSTTWLVIAADVAPAKIIASR
jgi:hypothetical protein